jgi:membrane protein DedA with SNARE-associated domain
MSEVLAQINGYLDYLFSYGPWLVYVVILAACFVENLFPPFPGDSFIVAAGGLVAVGRLEPIWSMAAVVSGGLASVMIWYFVGRRYGRDYFKRKNFRFFSAADIEAVEIRFARHGGLLLIASRFVVGMRVVLAIAAGIAGYPAPKMILHTFMSYILFSSLLMYLGFKLVENLDRIEYYFRTYNYIGWPIVVALVALYLFRRIKRTRKGSGK